MTPKIVTVNLNFAAFQADIDQAMQDVLQNVALAVEGEAKINAPVDTGFLRNSIVMAQDGNDYVVFVGAEYGFLMEARRSYLGAAADTVSQQVEAIAAPILSRVAR